MQISTLRVFSALLAAMLFWSVSFIWTKELLAYMGPITLIILRLLFSTLFLGAIARSMGTLRRIRGRDGWAVLVLALFNPLLYFLGENFAMQYVSPTLAAVVVGTIPLFTPLAAFFVLGERLGLRNYLGIGISALGVALVIGPQGLSAPGSWLGIAFLALAVAAAVLYALFIRRLSGRYTALHITVHQNAVGLLYFLPLGLAWESHLWPSIQWGWQLVGPLLGLSILCSSLAFVFFAYGIQHLGASKAGVFSNSIPVFTAFFSYLLLDEKLSLPQLAGVFIVIFGLLLSQLKSGPKTPRPSAPHSL